jgi:hypothetical protein
LSHPRIATVYDVGEAEGERGATVLAGACAAVEGAHAYRLSRPNHDIVL